MNSIKDIFHLFFPKLCITCNTKLVLNENLICTLCRHDLPIICYTNFKKNKIAASFYGKVPVEMATSFLFYRKEGKAKNLIHNLKYKGNQKIGSFIGNWFGNNLKETGAFNEINYVIPVPLHPKRLKERGYNQLTTFGISLANQLNSEYLPNTLIRITPAKTQTFKQRFERFNKNETIFNLTDIEFLRDKHVLLIDDVITTGATLESCCRELLKTKNIKISIATIAYTE